MSRVEPFLAQVGDWARAQAGVRAALLIGSQARVETPADEWSDVDIVLFVDDPGSFAAEAAWLSAFGTPELTFLEPAAVGGGPERRVLYDDGLEVDFALFPAAAIDAMTADPEAAAATARGYRVLHDEIGLESALAGGDAGAGVEPHRDPAEIVNDFWYHSLWTAKKLRRGEAFSARNCLECRLKGLLLELAGEHALRRDPGTDTWHRDRFVERWADPRALDALRRPTAGDPGSIAAALWPLCDAFDEIAAETTAPVPGAAAARDRLAVLLPRS